MMRLNSAASVVLLTERAVTCQLLATAASMMACSMEKPGKRAAGLRLTLSNSYARSKWLVIYSGGVFAEIQRLKVISLQSKRATVCKSTKNIGETLCSICILRREYHNEVKGQESYLHIIKRSVGDVIALGIN